MAIVAVGLPMLGLAALRPWIAAADSSEPRPRTRWCSPSPGKCHGRPEYLVEIPDFDVHPGAFTGPFAVDWDGDGDLDLVVTTISAISYYERVGSTSLVLREKQDNPFADVPAPWNSWPAVVDWDGDGDLDLLLGTWGELQYFERVADGSFSRVLWDGLPSAEARVPTSWLAPAVADWDGDGDLDLLVLAGSTLRYFERTSRTTIMERVGDQSPFAGINLGDFGFAEALSVADWDMDGDLDLVIGTGSESLLYFERMADGTLTERTRGANAFRHIIGGFAPFLVDWDQDGDLDLLVGTLAGGVRLFERQLDRNPTERTGVASPFHGVDLAGTLAVDWDHDGVKSEGDPGTLAVDWDQDGDVDLLVRNLDTGMIFYFERVNNSLVQHRVEDSPFHGIFLGSKGHASLAVADWNSDGNMDLLIATSDGTIHYFRSTAKGVLEEVERARSPFTGINASITGKDPSIAVVDWDSDGDIDLIVGGQHSISYFEQTASGALLERHGIMNPFSALPFFNTSPVPAVADWNNDGRLDLLVGEKQITHLFERLADGGFEDRTWTLNSINTYNADVGNAIHSLSVIDWNQDGDADLVVGTAGRSMHYFETGWCLVQDPCSAHGLCHPKLGTCSCMLGYELSDCSGCSWEHFSSGSLNVMMGSLPRTCSACPGMQESERPCHERGICFDDHSAQKSRAGLDTLAALARGNGTCRCMPHFGGESCEAGDCPAGFEYVQQDLWQCVPCRLGTAKRGTGKEARCTPCDAGQFAAVGGHACEACPAGRSSARSGMTNCDICPIGTYSARTGTSACKECPGGRFASSNGSRACEVCNSVWYRRAVDATHAECRPSWANLGALVVLIYSSIFFTILSALLCLPLTVLDVRPDEHGIVITTHGRHWLLWKSWKPTLQFRGTGVPWLDGEENEAGIVVHPKYRVERLSQTQLLLCRMDGSAETKASDTSIGSFRFGRKAFFMTGFQGVPFLCWVILLVLIVLGAACLGRGTAHLHILSLTISEATMVGAGALLAMTLGWLKWRSDRSTPLARDVRAFRLKLQQANPCPRLCERGVSRAITIAQLCELHDFFQAYIGSRDMHYVCNNLVKPLTLPLKLSYAELAGPSQVQWFVSHFWGTPFERFVSSINMHALAASGELDRRRGRAQNGDFPGPATKSWSQMAYWICTFSNSQWAVEEELGQLEEQDEMKSWKHSSFYKVLSSGLCRGTVMVFDQEAQPLTRSWCLFELLQTMELKQKRDNFMGLLLCTPSGVMNYGDGSLDLALTISTKLAGLRLETAEATKASDKEMIKMLVQESGGFAVVNAFLIRAVRGVLSAMQVRFQAELRVLQGSLTRSASQLGFADLDAADTEAAEGPLEGPTEAGSQVDSDAISLYGPKDANAAAKALAKDPPEGLMEAGRLVDSNEKKHLPTLLGFCINPARSADASPAAGATLKSTSQSQLPQVHEHCAPSKILVSL